MKIDLLGADQRSVHRHAQLGLRRHREHELALSGTSASGSCRRARWDGRAPRRPDRPCPCCRPARTASAAFTVCGARARRSPSDVERDVLATRRQRRQLRVRVRTVHLRDAHQPAVREPDRSRRRRTGSSSASAGRRSSSSSSKSSASTRRVDDELHAARECEQTRGDRDAAQQRRLGSSCVDLLRDGSGARHPCRAP